MSKTYREKNILAYSASASAMNKVHQVFQNFFFFVTDKEANELECLPLASLSSLVSRL
jgi:hypothetical protein